MMKLQNDPYALNYLRQTKIASVVDMSEDLTNKHLVTNILFVMSPTFSRACMNVTTVLLFSNIDFA